MIWRTIISFCGKHRTPVPHFGPQAKVDSAEIVFGTLLSGDGSQPSVRTSIMFTNKGEVLAGWDDNEFSYPKGPGMVIDLNVNFYDFDESLISDDRSEPHPPAAFTQAFYDMCYGPRSYWNAMVAKYRRSQ